MNLFQANRLLFIILFLASLASGAPKLVGINSAQNSVVAEFDQNINSADVKSGTVTSPVFKKYYDVNGILSIKPNLIQTPFQESKYAQFKPDTIRIVFTAPQNTIFSTTIQGKKLIISWDTPTQTSKALLKEIATDVPKEQITPQAIEPEIKPVFDEPKTKNKLIVLDPGHGGKDSGAVGVGGRKEKDAVLSIAKSAKESLEKRGYDVIMTRNDDTFIELKERTAFANSKNADLFISIHANAVDVKKTALGAHHGVETYFLSPARSERAKQASELENGGDMNEMDALTKGSFLNFLNRGKIVESNKLAIDEQKAILAKLHAKYPNTTDGGVREAPFWVLVGAQMPAILIETGYITHPQEGVTLSDPAYQNAFGKAITDGVDAYFANQ